MLAIGLLLGALAGLWLGHGFNGFIGGAFIGGMLGLIARALSRNAPQANADSAHIARLEARIERLEATVARLGAAPDAAPATPAPPSIVEPAPVPSVVAAEAPPPMPSYGVRPAAPSSAPPAAIAPPPVAARRDIDARIRRWLAEGNLPARVGVVVLLFGVAFLLRYFAEHFTVPIEARLAAVAAVGAALILFGVRLARTRAAFGVSVQGLGCGVLYLTTFAAFRLYAVLPANLAIATLIAVAALTVWRAVRSDSQALAGLAIAGGFLAPMLVGGGGSPVPLFAWFAVLNAAVVALAWRHSWRTLNVAGFVFTFVLGLAWGYRFYRPEWFGVVEPFLVLFFAFYVAIAVLYAKQQPLVMTAPVDGVLVFGVPLVGFALQFALVHAMPYGAAWSALALAAVYAVLFGALRGRSEPGLALLARAFGVLAIVFVTVAIPNALEARWTSAWWALEAAGVYWIGCRQAQPLTRAFALLLQFGAAALFVTSRGGTSALAPFANAAFAGSTVIALAGGATAWLAEREPSLTASERAVAPIGLAWAIAWWLSGGIQEMQRQHSAAALPALALAWCAGTALIALVLRKPLRWPRLAWAAAPLLPVLVLATLSAWQRERTTLTHLGWLVWPASFALHWGMLRVADRDSGTTLQPLRRDGVHTVSALVLIGWLAWEASEWTGRRTDPHTVWIACAAAWPAILSLWLCVLPAASARWPIAQHAEAYRRSAGVVVAFALLAWIAIVDLLSPGDPSPLAYVPLANPLDMTLIAAIAALAIWSRIAMTLADRDRYAVLAIAGFVALNGAVLRAAHHVGGIAWSLHDLLASRPLQAALTLTWTVTALALMLFATRRALRAWWSVGAALLAVVVAKLFLLDLATLSGLPRVVAFLGVGALLLVIGYVAPFPPVRETAQAPPH